MDPLTAALIGAGFSAVGSGLNYLGTKNEAKRRGGAMQKYTDLQQGLDSRLLQSLALQSQDEQAADINSIRAMGAPAMQQAAGDQAARGERVKSLLATLAPASPSAGATPATQAGAQARRAGRYQLNRQSADLLQLLAGQDRAKKVGATEAQLPAQANAPAWQTARDMNRTATDNNKALLKRTLATTSNRSNNLQLLGALSNMGADVMFGLGGMGGGMKPGGMGAGGTFESPGMVEQ